MSDAALAAAVTVAQQHGVPVRDPSIVAVGSNVIVRLAPEGPIARVAGLTAQARNATEWFGREVAIARVLHLRGAPVVAPFEPAGPHTHDGHIVTLWALADGERDTDGARAGRALADCHGALLGGRTKLDLPPLTILLAEADSIAGRTRLAADEERLVRGALERCETAIAQTGLPDQPLHGDAGLGNVLGGLWNDWEDACYGPVAWDLACLVATARATGERQEIAEAALAAHGGELLDVFVLARVAQTAAWSAFTLAQAGRDSGRLTQRLDWLRGESLARRRIER